MNRKHLFLATPITPLLFENNCFCHQAERSIKTILSFLRYDMNCHVTCAIERELWGKALMRATECTPSDLLGICRSDALIAFPGESFGVHLEIGWATAHHKPIILCIRRETGVKTPLVDGLKTIGNVFQLEYDSEGIMPDKSEWEDNLRPRLSNILEIYRTDEVRTIGEKIELTKPIFS